MRTALVPRSTATGGRSLVTVTVTAVTGSTLHKSAAISSAIRSSRSGSAFGAQRLDAFAHLAVVDRVGNVVRCAGTPQVRRR